MSAQPEHGWGTMPLPEIRTVDDLRGALSRYGFPGDRERFEEELATAIGASSANDFEAAAAVVRAYRHRVMIRNSPEAMTALEDARTGDRRHVRKAPLRDPRAVD
ncbi:hypothetical protein [Streptomyces griseus]|uniref:hypothetical protein n=1 Tax=Streptomyces griseus TaxID=1911 RepID=UPI00131D6551|nr:hypothetical protein [Streptomyces griseus]